MSTALSISSLPSLPVQAPRYRPTSIEDLRQHPMASYAITYTIAIILIFFAMCGFLPVASARTSSLQGMSNDADTLFGQAFQALIWGIALLLMLPYWRPILRLCGRMRAMTALSLLAPLSCLWSQSPLYSLRRGIFLSLGTLFAFYLVSRFSPRDLAQIIVITGVVCGIFGIATSLFVPSIGIDSFNGGAWQGIFRSKNGCAQIMLFLMSPVAAFRFHSRFMGLLRLFLILLTALLLVMSQAKTAWLLAPAYVVLMLVLSATRRFERRDAVLILVGCSIAVIVIALAIPYFLPLILETLGKDAQISGRLPLWLGSLASIAKRPLLGYGYQAFWLGLRGESLNVFMATHFEIYQAQNGLLEVALELGLVGVSLVLLTLIRAIRDAFVCFRHGHSSAASWYVGILALSACYNVDETFLASAHSLPWLLYIVACAGLHLEARRAQRIP